MTYPEPDAKRRMELQQIRARLAEGDGGKQAQSLDARETLSASASEEPAAFG
jgi:hypothetical protein